MKKGPFPVVGIMVNSLKEKDAFSEYFSLRESLKIEIFLFRPKDVQWKTSEIRGVTYSKGWKRKKFSFPNVVYNRYYSDKADNIDRISKIIGADKCYNRITRFNKWEIHEILSNSKIAEYLPHTQKYSSEKLIELLKEYKNILIKDVKGSLGKNIYWVARTDEGKYVGYQDNIFPKYFFETEQELISKIEEITSKSDYVIQKKLSLLKADGHHVDFRVMIQKNIIGHWQVTAMLARVAYKNNFVTNITKKVVSVKEVLNKLSFSDERINEIINNIQQVCIDSAKLIESKKGHCAELGFDIVLDEIGQLWIIEANGRPSKKLCKLLNDQEVVEDIYKKPLEYACYLLSNKDKTTKRKQLMKSVKKKLI